MAVQADEHEADAGHAPLLLGDSDLGPLRADRMTIPRMRWGSQAPTSEAPRDFGSPGQNESGSQRGSRPFLWSEEKLPDYFCDSSRRTYWARSKANGSAACFWLSLPRKSATEVYPFSVIHSSS